MSQNEKHHGVVILTPGPCLEGWPPGLPGLVCPEASKARGLWATLWLGSQITFGTSESIQVPRKGTQILSISCSPSYFLIPDFASV